MKPIFFTLAIVMSLAVSVALLVSMLNIDLTESEEQQKPQQPPQLKPELKTEVAQQKPEITTEVTQQPKKLYTIDDLAEHPEIYNYDEAWDIFRVVYLTNMQFCHDEYEDDVITLNECVTHMTSWWLQIEGILERAY